MGDFQTYIDKLGTYADRKIVPISTGIINPPTNPININSPKGSIAIPTMGGRSSLPQNVSLFGVIIDEMAQIQPGFELEMLRACEFLAKYNGDVSYAVDNVCQLGNTPYTVKFDSSVKDEQAKKMIRVINAQTRWLYPGGMKTLISDLYAQLYITGAISAECIPDKSISYIQKVSLVSPYSVRFMYNPDTYEYDQYQTMSGFGSILIPSSAAGNIGQMGLHRLNPVTYRYIAHRRFNDNPFAIPPIISSFEGIEIEKDMLNNMRHIVRKMGVFGFLSVMVTAPIRKQGETETAYFARCTNYLNQIRPEVEKGYATGVALGFKGFQEWKVEAGNTNLAGAKEMFQLVSEIKMAGLKQDPLMLGRNFNVAETMAKVIMSKLTTQIGSYQAILATFIEDLYKMILMLNGFSVERVMIEFEPPMIGDKLRDAQAREKEIANVVAERGHGFISQQDAVNKLGWDEPHADKDVDYTVAHAEDIAKKAKPGDPAAVNDAVNPGATEYSISYLELQLNRGLPEFDYGLDCNCGNHIHSFIKGNKEQNKLVALTEQYLNSANAVYYNVVDKVTLQIGVELAALNKNATLQEVTDKVFYILYNNFNEEYSLKQEVVIKKWVKQAYNFFREDKGVFGDVTEITDKAGKVIPIPDATFGLYDVRAVKYFKEVDQLYLGKFITDTDTKKAITEFIKDKYLKGATPIGDNKDAIEIFKNEFGDVLNLEDWKIRRIIDTSVNKMRNYAALASISDAGIAYFKIVGVNDRLQCPYCSAMQGYRFSVSIAMDKAKKIVQGNGHTLGVDAPFVTSLFKGQEGINKIQELTGEELQAQGLLGAPPFHSNCRDTIVADL